MKVRARRTLRWLLCMLVVLGLVPGTAELLENLEHLLHDGHLAHSAAHELARADEICGSDVDEHGCTPLAHDCGCCVSLAGLPALPGPTLEIPLLVAASGRVGSLPERGPPSRDVGPEHRPPIP